MKNSELQKILANFVSPQWKRGILRGLNDSYQCWLPIVKMNEDIWYGLSEDGRWVAGAENENVRLVELSIDGSAVPLLPCLEHPQSEIESLVTSALKSAGLPETVAHTFPFDAGVICGLTSSSNYWSELALEWLQNIPINETIAKALADVVKSKRLSQKNRHQAAKLFKEWRKSTQSG